MDAILRGSIDRRDFIRLTSGAVVAAVTPAWACGPARSPRPNIIYIMADDLGYGDLGVYGRADYKTPFLDGLAAAGLRFTEAYAIAPVCTPTRVGFMTGRYPARHPLGLKEPLTTSLRDRELGLPAHDVTLSSLLAAAGYHNALVGKWHLGLRPEFRPDRHRFEYSFGPLHGAVDYIDHHNTAGEHDLYRNGQEVYQHGYLTDLLTEEAIAFVRKRREPFFLSLQYTAPHWPWQRRGDAPYPRERRLSDDGPADIYPDMVRAMDEGVGRILDALSAEGLAGNTLAIFTSDNGGERFSNMGTLTGGKMQLWEGGIRVPAIVRWPGVIPAGETTPQVATTLDWAATILAAAGVSPGIQPLDGLNLLPIMTDHEQIRERTVFWRTFQRTRHKAVRTGYWKYLATEDGDHLFDLAEDPGERSDLKLSRPDVFEKLKSQYAAWESEMLEPVPL